MRQIFFPAHVTPTNVLEMARCCTKVTHVSLSRNTQLNLDHLEEILHTMTHLEQLDVFTSDIKCEQLPWNHHKDIERLLKVAATGIKKLVLRIDQSGHHHIDQLHLCMPTRSVLMAFEELLKEGHALPSISNIFMYVDYIDSSSHTLESPQWSASNYKKASYEIYLKDYH